MLLRRNCATAASDWGPNRTTAPTPWGPNRSTSFGREPRLPLWRQPSVGASVRLEEGTGGLFFLPPEGCRVQCRRKNGRGSCLNPFVLAEYRVLGMRLLRLENYFQEVKEASERVMWADAAFRVGEP